MKIEHIVSTMNQVDLSFLIKMDTKFPALVVNQHTEDMILPISNFGDIVVINSNTIGLSTSRNLLLENSLADICIITDDDLVYRRGYDKAIIDAYLRIKDADVIIFDFSTSESEDNKCKWKNLKRLNRFHISKIASVEITFKREKILQSNIEFDKDFGLGAKYPSGEENAFLMDCLRKKLNVYYVPFTICYSIEDETKKKWKNGYDNNYLIMKGACFQRIYHNLSPLFIVAFVILKKKIMLQDMSYLNALKSMFKGRRKYLNERFK